VDGRPNTQVTICICTPDLDAYSETFIRAHIRHLPAVGAVLFGSFPIACESTGRPLLPLPGRVLYRFRNRLPRPANALAARLADFSLARFLRTRKISVVLAEYGTTRVALVNACSSARIPLVVHFHGFDAYRTDVITGNDGYRGLFAKAAAVIAVAREMQARLVDLGCPFEKVHYVPYGVDTSLFRPSSQRLAEPVFLAVGRFVEKKAPTGPSWHFARSCRSFLGRASG